MIPIPNGNYDGLGIYRATEVTRWIPLPKADWITLEKEARYQQFRKRARWFTLARFDWELARRRDWLSDAIDFDYYCKVRSLSNPIPRDPFDITPFIFHETQGAMSAPEAQKYFSGGFPNE